MKRGAEKQLSKDDHSDGEGQDDAPQVGFKRADESVLAARKIRGLPKRASVAAIPPPATEASSIKFGAFTGLSGCSSSFSDPTTSTTASTTAPTNFFTSTTTQTTTAKSLTSLLSSSPVVNSFSSTNSTSASTSTSPLATPPTTSLFTPTPASSAPASTKKDATADPAELKYYTSLRGLNESLRAAINKAIDDDAFADITLFLERYKTLRTDIQKEFDTKASPLSSSHTATSVPSVPVAKTFSMPVPPQGGILFGGAKAPTSTDAKPSTMPSSGGFVPVFGIKHKTEKSDGPIPSLPFSFASKPIDTATTPALFGPKQPETSKDPSPASSAPSPSLFPVLTPPKQPDSNGVKSSTSVPLALSDSTKSESKPTSIFSSSTPSFGFSSSSSFNLGSSTQPGDIPAPITGNRFAGFAGFGTSSKPAATSASFGFKPSLIAPAIAPSLGSSLAKMPSTLTATASDSSANSDATGTATTTAPSGANAEASDDAPKRNIAESFILDMDNKYDQEGAGEEDEETVHSVKLKAYVMKDEKGAKSWAELGYGVLRIKKHKETQVRRVLLRSSSTGQILINFNFHPAFNPTQKGKNVTFLGHNAESASKMYTLKLQTQEQATGLTAAFDREIHARNSSGS